MIIDLTKQQPKYTSLQEVFNAAVAGLAKQGFRQCIVNGCCCLWARWHGLCYWPEERRHDHAMTPKS